MHVWRAGAGKPQLLLSYIRPHTEVVPCTIAGWLVQLMKQSGIDTSGFVLIHSEVHLLLRVKPKAPPVRRFWLWLTVRKNLPLGGIIRGRLLVIAQAPFKLLYSKKVSMDFKHTLLYLMKVCEGKFEILPVREAHALKL